MPQDEIIRRLTSRFPPLGRRDSTTTTYKQRGKKLATRLSKASNSLDPSHLVAQFVANPTGFSQRTFRLYKASLLQHLADGLVAPSVLKHLRESTSKHFTRRSLLTSGKKAKKVDATDRYLLLTLLRSRNSNTSSLAADYFQAGLVAGPRPIEWLGAQILNAPHQLPLDAPQGTTHILTFPNAKRDEKEIRGNGATRSMHMTLNADDAATITRVIANAALHTNDWSLHYDRLRAVLRYAAKSIWPKRTKLPTFYTTRHQAQADAKAQGRKPNEVAAMFGHASDNTATQHYARASQGDKNMYKMAPTAVSLAKVRNQKVTSRLQARAIPTAKKVKDKG